VIDYRHDKVVGRIMDTPGVHGIAVGAGKVFTSNGRENKVSVVDPKTLATLSKIDTGGANPTPSHSMQNERSVGVQSHGPLRDANRCEDRHGRGRDSADGHG
jgi:YVTN family beta-propeller protein